MSKTHGLGAGLLVGGYDLSGDIGAVQRIACPRSVLDVTDITQSAPERRLALKDGGIDYTAYFNPSTDRAHPVLSALPRTDTLTSYLHRRTLGAVAAAMVGKQINYDPNRTQDGALTIAVNAVSNAYGLEWGHLLTDGVEASGGAEDLTGFDDGAGAATNFGLQAYLHVTAFTGTSVDISLEDSDDDGTDPYAAVTGAAFTTVTAAPYFQRIATSRTENVKEWLRVTTAGTYSALSLAVVVVRNRATVTF